MTSTRSMSVDGRGGMSWIAEAWHVARKDLRHARWMTLAYLLLIVIITLRVVGVLLPDHFALSFATPMLSMLAILLVATMVQEDSPARADAYWAALPLRESAILSGKGIAMALLLLPAIAAHAFLLWWLGVPSALVPGMLLRAMWVFVAWLLAAALLGCVTRDIKALILACIVGSITVLVLYSTLPVQKASVYVYRHGLSGIAIVCALCFALLVLHTMYRVRDRGRIAWVGALLGVAMLLFVTSTWPWYLSAKVRPALGRHSAPPALTVRADSAGLESGGVSVQLSVWSAVPDSLQRFLVSIDGFDAPGAEPQHDARSVDSAVVALGSAGSFNYGNSSLDIQPPIPPAPQGTRWSPMRSTFRLPLARRKITLTPEGWRRVREGAATIRVFGTVTELEATPPVTLPMAGTGWARVHNIRMRADRLHDAPGRFRVRVTRSEREELVGVDYAERRRSYALVNPSRGESLLLFTGGSGYEAELLVLPTSPMVRASEDAEVPSDGSSVETMQLQPTSSFLEGARLVLIRWNTVRRYNAVFGPATLQNSP